MKLSTKVRVKEGNTILECTCPTDKCCDCLLRFRCYTSRPMTDLTLREKMLLLQGQDGNGPNPVKVIEEADGS